MTEPTPAPTPQPTPAATPYVAPVAGAPTNVLSIIALIGGFVIPLAGIIVGFIALSQIKKTGENGRGLAIAGIIIGFVIGIFTLLIVLFSILLPLILVGTSGYSTY